MSSAETERTAVKTYVPAYQKETWARHADEMDMPLSEFVRTMVQAGRRGFDGGDTDPTDASGETGLEHDPSGSDPRGDALETRVLDVLDGEECLSWEELLQALTHDVEERLEAALTDLQSANRVQYSGRYGGYVLLEGGDE